MRQWRYRLMGGVLTAAALTPAVAFGQEDNFTVPVNISEYITESISKLGAIVAVAVGGYFGFLLVRMGLRWARRVT